MKELSFNVTGGEKRIEYTVNCDNAEIGAVASASWIQVSVSSSLFTITVSENTSADRRAYIIPTLNGEYCDTTANKLSVFQKGVSTGCSVTLVISGLKNSDKATIDWGDETTSENKKNGTYRHRYTSGDEHTVTVTAENYSTGTGTFICGSVTSLTIDMQGGVTPICLLQGPDSITMRSYETSGLIEFTSMCENNYAEVEVVDQGALEDVVITHTTGTNGTITFNYTGTTNTRLVIGQTNGDAQNHTVDIIRGGCIVNFNISGSYNYIDMVALQGDSSGGAYILNGEGSTRTAEIPCGITFTGIVFNNTSQQHCAYFTDSTGGTISNGATFNATITGTTCS